MSKVDTAWLRMEQPSNLMMITGVIGLEGDVDYERLLEVVEQRFLVFNRFRQKAVDSASGACWEMDEDFDLRSHVRRVALPGEADEQELRILVSHLASSPLNHARPLWQFHLVENFERGPVLICRIHHCIADGIALVQVFLSLTDDAPDPEPAVEDPETWTRDRSGESPVFQRLLEPARDGIDMAVHLGQKAIEEGLSLLQDPARASRYAHEAGEIIGELGHALALPSDPQTRLKGRLGPRKEVAWAKSLPLDEVKAVSKAFGCTVNDVLIACASGALRRYLLEHGGSADAAHDIRATVPVNLRPLEHALELGNHFGLVFLELPVSLDNPLERLYVVNDRMTELKHSKQAAMTFGFLAALGMGPSALQRPVLDLLSEKASAVLTNVPGPQQPLYIAGTEMRSIMFWVPQNGNIGVGISILSYNGRVFFGLITDRRRVPDPQAIIDRFRPEFDKLLYLAMMLPLEGRPPLEQAEALINGDQD
jgi:WS/DGAT/MGAT family acyltransferase